MIVVVPVTFCVNDAGPVTTIAAFVPAGRPVTFTCSVPVAAVTAAYATVTVDEPLEVTVDGEPVTVAVYRVAPAVASAAVTV